MGKSTLYVLLLLISLMALTTCKPHAEADNKPDDGNQDVAHKRTRIVQNPFAPFAIPVLLPEEDEGSSESEANESKTSEISERKSEEKPLDG